MTYKEKIQIEIKNAIKNADNDDVEILLERPKQKEHGDLSTNIAMLLAKKLKKNPLEIAGEIKEKIKSDSISSIDIAKPGFLNLIVSNLAFCESLSEVHSKNYSYGYGKPRSKEKVLVEYVSANPTGDLHIGHGRQAVIGDTLARILEAAGYDVSKEYYINDHGEQIQKLRESVWATYEKSNGKNIEWKEEFYPYETLLPYVKKAIENNVDLSINENLGNAVKDLILEDQKKLLNSFNVSFNVWFSETTLHTSGKVNEILKKLNENNATYESEGALWFKAKDFGDVRDRVLIRSDGRPTYLLADVAYHVDKINRGFNNLINVWGADHHGQEVGLKGCLKACGVDAEKLEVLFVQLVSLKLSGQEVKMSKRTGTVVTVKEVLDEVGQDAFRYFLIDSHPNNRMVFDIELAKKQDKDNPVFYIQYAHARCCSIFRQLSSVENLQINIDDLRKEFLNKNTFLKLFSGSNEELDATKSLILKILDFPEEVQIAAKIKWAGRIANYLKELASDFHRFYTVCRVITDDKDLTKSRLGLVDATRISIHNGLKILGMTAPEKM